MLVEKEKVNMSACDFHSLAKAFSWLIVITSCDESCICQISVHHFLFSTSLVVFHFLSLSFFHFLFYSLLLPCSFTISFSHSLSFNVILSLSNSFCILYKSVRLLSSGTLKSPPDKLPILLSLLKFIILLSI